MTRWYFKEPIFDSWDIVADTDGLTMNEFWQKIEKSVWKDGVIQAGGWNLDSAIVINEYEFLMTLEQRARNYVTHFRKW